MGWPLTAAVGGLWQRTGNYCLALRRLGVTPVVTLDTSLAASCDLLILPGGNDPDPSLFGEPWCGSRIVERALDLRQLALLTAFVRTRKPVLGICKGMQLINIWFGGSVIQDLSTRSLHQYSGQDQVHGSAAAAGSWLAALYGTAFFVNSAHHQGIGLPGRELQIIQKAPDGVSEALVHEKLPIFGVQWHPERMAFSLRRSDTPDGKPVLEYLLRLAAQR